MNFEKRIADPATRILRIIVHDGLAHTDERIASAMTYAKARNIKPGIKLEVVRTRESLSEIPGVVTIFVDVGLKYDHEFNFDHHQDSKEVYEKCAATLVAERFYPELFQHPEYAKFLERVRIHDTKGLSFAAEIYGNDEVYPFMMDEFEANRRFELDPVKETEINAEVIERYAKQSRDYRASLAWAERSIDVNKCSIGPVIIWKPESDAIKSEMDFGILRMVNSYLIEKNSAVAAVGYDSTTKYEGIVYRFFRTYIGDKLLDFKKWAPAEGSKPGVKFCHKNGFLMLVKDFDSTVDTGTDTIIGILEKCVV